MRMFFLVSLFSLLVACGGGGGGGGDSAGSPSPSNPVPVIVDEDAQGFWEGTTNTGRLLQGVVLDNGDYYVLYYTADQSAIAGVVQGSSTMSGSAFTSTDGKDFFIEGDEVYDVEVRATVDEKNSFNGTVDYGAEEVTFTSTYNVEYEQTPSLSQLAGSFSGQVAFGHQNVTSGIENAVIQVGSDGSLSGVGQSGCTVGGVVSTHTNGNIFDLEMTFGDSPCYFRNMTLRGILYYDTENNISLGVATVSARDAGILFVGTKQ